MRLLRLLSFTSAVALAVAQYAACIQDPQYNWMYNSLNQDPCTVAEYLGGVCNNGVFHVPPLNRTQEYIGPTATTANECRCSTVFFSLLSACAICQVAQTTTWSFYDGNCSQSYSGVFTMPIPSGTRVPHWAYMDVTAYDGFNVTIAQEMTDSPESTAVSSATGTSTIVVTPSSTDSSSPSSSSKSSIAGPIAGGVVGGVLAIALVVILVVLLRRRKSKPNQVILADPQQHAILVDPQQSQIPTGDKEYHQLYQNLPPIQKPLLYDPSDPRTFPSSPPPVPIQAATTNGTVNPAITGSSFSSAPTVGGTYFPGVAEV